ncbi:MAG: YggS family pyridoxal phosphate-dependent enzyme [Candidatus Micrarchaeota archaeon]
MLSESVSKIKGEIRAACKKANRQAGTVRLIAVSKNQQIASIIAAHNSGISDFGENRVQEAKEKIRALANEKITWHFVGRLQNNKARKAAQLFELIHSIGSFEMAETINQEAAKIQKKQKILLQVNISGEKTKSGFSESELLQIFPQLLRLPHVSIRGLMTIAPITENPENSREIFRKLSLLRGKLEQIHSVSLPELSMGMSQDYRVAVEEGATMVRVGAALFGGRK